MGVTQRLTQTVKCYCDPGDQTEQSTPSGAHAHPGQGQGQGRLPLEFIFAVEI